MQKIKSKRQRTVTSSQPSPSADKSLFVFNPLGIEKQRQIGKKIREAKMLISGVDLGHSPRGRRARFARKWFKLNGPPDAPPLPLGYDEREALKRGGVSHIVAWYARSVACGDYDVEKHPSFYDYVCGLMASEYAPDFIKKDEELQRRFPPRPLAGLGPALVWEPPELHAETMASYRRSLARAAS